MSHPYRSYANAFAALVEEARGLPQGGFDPEPCPAPAPDAPLALVFAPHPDDESIVGALPLRLMRELGQRVAVVAVTLGSNLARRAARLDEMRGACGFLGFRLLPTRDGGLTGINPKSRAEDPEAWAESVALIAAMIQDLQPGTVFCPHALDGNSTHRGTHWLVMDALGRLGPGFACNVVETEFWSALETPNLMVESTPEELGDLMAAISFHKGEVARNPYHVRLPAWMSDNVRRGGELVGGQGGAVPDFAFATLYRLRRWTGTRLEERLPAGLQIPAGSDGLLRWFGA